MTRGTPLITLAQVTALTGVQDLANVEAGGGIDLDAAAGLLTAASDAIYDQLVGDGETPASLTNDTVYESAVAYHFLARLVILGFIDLPKNLEPPRDERGQADPFAWSDPYYRRVRPTYATLDSSRSAGDAVPVVRNVSTRPLFGGTLS